ncbi:hypothetical protein ACFPRL_26440 [Pseudoclavibacter helvolus]
MATPARDRARGACRRRQPRQPEPLRHGGSARRELADDHGARGRVRG